jgi:hypothetical protein
MTETQITPDGSPVGTDVWTIAISRPGSFVEAHESRNGIAIGPKRIIVDVINLRRVSVDPPTESITTYPLSRKTITGLLDFKFSCSDDPGAEHKQFFGHQAVKVTHERLAGTVKLGYEDWIATELGCLVVKSTVKRYQNGIFQATRYKDVTALTLGEPYSSLFQIPQTFVERKPSEVMQESARRKGEQCSECDKRSGPVLDKVYDSHR